MNDSRLGIVLGIVTVLAFVAAGCSGSSPAPAATPITPIVTPITLPTATATATAMATQVPSPVPPTPPPTLTTTAPPAIAMPVVVPVVVIAASATLGACDFRLEVADTTTERGRGLMNRASMPHDQGMLFVYGIQQELNFWMRHTLIPLDIVFLNDALTVVDVQTMIPEHEILPNLLPIYTSAAPAKFALEVNAGVAADCGITPNLVMSLSYLN